MATVDQGYADWLKSDALYSQASVSGAAAKWGTLGIETTTITPLAFGIDADAEAAAQAAFFAGPIAKDTARVQGLRSDLIGKVITLSGDRLGYQGGAPALVIGAQEQDGARLTVLTVLKVMA